MPMTTMSISVTDQEAAWVKNRIKTCHYDDESEVMRELIQERQMQEQQTPEEIAAIRAALAEAEESIKREGYSKQSVEEIWEEALAEYKD